MLDSFNIDGISSKFTRDYDVSTYRVLFVLVTVYCVYFSRCMCGWAACSSRKPTSRLSVSMWLRPTAGLWRNSHCRSEQRGHLRVSTGLLSMGVLWGLCWWFSARPQWLQCLSSAVTTLLHWVIDVVWDYYQLSVRGFLWSGDYFLMDLEGHYEKFKCLRYTWTVNQTINSLVKCDTLLPIWYHCNFQVGAVRILLAAVIWRL